jgi:hypothetical protein
MSAEPVESDAAFYARGFTEREHKRGFCTASQAEMLRNWGVANPESVRFEDVDQVLKEAIATAPPKLTACPVHPGGVHLWLPATACELLRHKWSREEIARYLREASKDCGRPVPASEIKDAINYAEREVKGEASDFKWSERTIHKKPVYKPDTLQQVADRMGSTVVDTAYLWARSPFTPWNRSPAGILHKLYQPGEKVIVFDIFNSQGQAVWTHPGITGDLSTLDRFERGHQNVWFLLPPVDGLYHWNPRQGKESRRSEESITAWRDLLVESDKAPKDIWLRALVQLPLPIMAITDSGSKSIHAIVRVDAESKAHFTEIVTRKLKHALATLGADKDVMNPARLTRLGNCERLEKGSVQTLLYLNDSPKDTPIAHRLPRPMPCFHPTAEPENDGFELSEI